ncbi:lipocalin family protein, partial [Campylobacter jejuni]|uniref:lipocalin family protein n=1 Tax=Campylobacter jejuni TaxID=197 RepID=UPI001A9C9452
NKVNYEIIFVDSEYKVASVGSPDKKYLWILARNIIDEFFIKELLKHGLAGKGGVLVTTMIPIFSYLIFMIAIFFQKNKKSTHKITKSEILGLFLGLLSGFCLLNLGSLEDLFGKFNILFLTCSFIWAL